MLYPQTNRYRTVLDLSGIWKFKVDPNAVGEQEKWFERLESPIEIAVPGSWNEQLEELGLLHYVGAAWYGSTVCIPTEFSGRRIWLRVGSADNASKVWVNGQCAGEYNNGFLPFELDVTHLVKPGEDAAVVILVDSSLTYETIPQGVRTQDYTDEKRLREETYPPARFDFSPFGGIHRPVHLFATPQSCIQDIKVETQILPGKKGLLAVRAKVLEGDGLKLTCRIGDVDAQSGAVTTVNKGEAKSELWIDNCQLWSPAYPHLYNLVVDLVGPNGVKDSYALKVGVREIKIAGDTLLLNGEPVYLKGFGKHEDFAVTGKGLVLPVVVKDFLLMKWINANSFRTSHYPYAEEILAMADRQGFLVIDEVPAVSLDMRHVNEQSRANHKEFIRKLFDRDSNHPSVIMWALGNEPNLVGDEGYCNGSGKEYWKDVFAYARSLDSTRPMIVPNCQRAGTCDPVFEFSDIIAINRYYGWYEYPGRLEYAVHVLEEEMDLLHSKYRKPVMVTEFGADTVPGLHSTSDQLFTEQYQEKLLEMYIKLIRSKSYTIGEHVWNFADFRTPQHFRRVFLNMKGVFTRSRQPKLAAFKLKSLWAERDGN
jgi:beta-glucuronidase